MSEFHLYAIIVFIFGTVFGSFLNVVIYRVPRGENIAYPPSACPQCNTQIKAKHNIPVLSWFMLKGKCAYCGTSINKKYPIVEFISGVIALVIYLKVGEVWYVPSIIVFFLLLFALAIIDASEKKNQIPIYLSLALYIFGAISPYGIKNMIWAFLISLTLYSIKQKSIRKEDILTIGATVLVLGVVNAICMLLFLMAISYIPYSVWEEKEYREQNTFALTPYIFGATIIFYILDCYRFPL